MVINPPPSVENFGGKGYQLFLLQDTCNIPDFFVINFDRDEEIMNKEIHKKILNFYDLNDFGYVSVRSSATVEDSNKASFAGMFESKLNIDRTNLIEAIKYVMYSSKEHRVKDYCDSKKIKFKQIHMRVVIQKMINSRVSGVCLTRDKKLSNNMLVEACWGLGESLVNGSETPDSYYINRDTYMIELEKRGFQKNMILYNQQSKSEVPFHKRNARKLTSIEIKKVAQECLNIENQLSYEAVDIEWAFQNSELFILQARPFLGV